MASTRRGSHASLKADIFENFQSYDLFQAIRMLEALASAESRDAGLDAVEPVGRNVDPDKAPLRIRAAVPLGYAAAEVTSVRRPRNGDPIELTQSVVGLTGPSGVLPHAFSELVQMSVRERNPALREFLDVFNNRLTALLYEAWAKYRIVIERERASTVGTARTIDHALKSLIGLGFDSAQARTAIPDSAYVFFGGLIGRPSRSAFAVESILSGGLGHDVRTEQFLGEWIAIAPDDRTRLPDATAPEGAHARLGEDAVLGASVFDMESAVLICVGPLDYGDFRALLPDGPRAPLLTDLAANALGPDKSFRIRLELKKDQVPGLRLEADKASPTASRLGWNTWITSATPRQAPAAAEFRPLPHLR